MPGRRLHPSLTHLPARRHHPIVQRKTGAASGLLTATGPVRVKPGLGPGGRSGHLLLSFRLERHPSVALATQRLLAPGNLSREDSAHDYGPPGLWKHTCPGRSSGPSGPGPATGLSLTSNPSPSRRSSGVSPAPPGLASAGALETSWVRNPPVLSQLIRQPVRSCRELGFPARSRDATLRLRLLEAVPRFARPAGSTPVLWSHPDGRPGAREPPGYF